MHRTVWLRFCLSLCMLAVVAACTALPVLQAPAQTSSGAPNSDRLI